MGTWGYRTFENDEALDWLLDFNELEGDPLCFLETSLRRKESNTDRFERLLAASEVVAALRGHPSKDFPRDRRTIHTLRGIPKTNLDHLAQTARQAVALISGEPSVLSLWVDHADIVVWMSVLDDIVKRLLLPPKPLRLRIAKPRAQSPETSIVGRFVDFYGDSSGVRISNPELSMLPRPGTPIRGSDGESMAGEVSRIELNIFSEFSSEQWRLLAGWSDEWAPTPTRIVDHTRADEPIVVTDPIKHFATSKSLALHFSNPVNLDVLESLHGVCTLELSLRRQCGTTSLLPLGGMTSLQHLRLISGRFKDCETLGGLTSLLRVDLGDVRMGGDLSKVLPTRVTLTHGT